MAVTIAAAGGATTPISAHNTTGVTPTLPAINTTISTSVGITNIPTLANITGTADAVTESMDVDVIPDINIVQYASERHDDHTIPLDKSSILDRYRVSPGSKQTRDHSESNSSRHSKVS